MSHVSNHLKLEVFCYKYLAYGQTSELARLISILTGYIDYDYNRRLIL